MALIKSALELALERTKDIQGDKESLDAKHCRELGMKLAARSESEPDLDIRKELGAWKGKELDWVKEGMRGVLMTSIAIPSSEASVQRLERFIPLFSALSTKPKDMEGMMGEIVQFSSQYLQQRQQMIETLRKQLEPKLKQKEDAAFQQTGRRVRLSLETDPECAKYLSMNLDKLNAQYETALEGIRTEILGLLA